MSDEISQLGRIKKFAGTPQQWWDLAPWNYDMDSAPKDARCLLKYSFPVFNGINYVTGKFNDDKYAARPNPYWEHDLYRLSGVRETRSIQPVAWLPLPEQK